MSPQCVPVQLPSSQHPTSLDRGIKGSKIYQVPTRFCGTGSWGQKGSMCLYVFGWLQSKSNALLNTPDLAEGEQRSRRNCSAQTLCLLLRTGDNGWQERRQSRSRSFGHTLLTASQGSEGCGKLSLLLASKGRALEYSPSCPPHRTEEDWSSSPSMSPRRGVTAEGTQPPPEPSPQTHP